MGRNISAASAAAALGPLDYVYPQVGFTDIAANALVFVDELGMARPYDTSKGALALDISDVAGPGSFLAPQTWANDYRATPATMAPVQSVVQLTNGNFAHAYCNTSLGSAYPYFEIRTPNGVVVKSATNITSTTVASDRVRVVALSTGGFVVVFASSSGAHRFAVFDNAGAVVTAYGTSNMPTIAAQNASDYATWDVVALTAGKWALVYQKNGSPYNICYAIYTNTGAVSVAETQIGSLVGNVSNSYVAAITCANGDFVAFVMPNSGSVSVARITSSGVLVGSVQTVSTQTGLTATNIACTLQQKSAIVELSNGAFATFAVRSGVSSYCDLAIVNAGFTAVTAVPLTTTNISLSNGNLALAASPYGGFAVYYSNLTSGAQYLASFDNAGAPVVTETAASYSVSTGSYSTRVLFASAAGWVLVSHGYSSTGANAQLSIQTISPTGLTVGSALTLATAMGDTKGQPFGMMNTTTGMLHLFYNRLGGGDFTHAIIRCTRSGVLGVSTEAKSALSPSIKIATKGSFALAGTPPPPGGFDGTAATVRGPKGSVLGTLALLTGF